MLNQRNPRNNAPNPTNACPKPFSFSHQLVSSDKSLYNPSIVLTTPNFAQSKINLTTLAIPSKIPITFCLFFGSANHLSAGTTTNNLNKPPNIFMIASKKLPVPVTSCPTKLTSFLSFFGSVYSASNFFFCFSCNSNLPIMADFKPATIPAIEFRVAPRLFTA